MANLPQCLTKDPYLNFPARTHRHVQKTMYINGNHLDELWLLVFEGFAEAFRFH